MNIKDGDDGDFMQPWRSCNNWLKDVCVCVCVDMLRVSEGQGTRLPKTRAIQRSTLTSVLQFLGKDSRTISPVFWISVKPAEHQLFMRASCSSCVMSLPESRPVAHAPRSHRTAGLQTPPPRRLLSSLPHGPHGMLGKRSYHHHSRAEPDRRSGTQNTLTSQSNLELIDGLNWFKAGFFKLIQNGKSKMEKKIFTHTYIYIYRYILKNIFFIFILSSGLYLRILRSKLEFWLFLIVRSKSELWHENSYLFLLSNQS